MKMKAAVCREYKSPITIEEVELDPPKEKEVLVKTAFTGFCHSDWSAVAGWLSFPLPLVLGHEATGAVGAIAQVYWAMGIGGKQIQIGIHSMYDTVPMSLSFTPVHRRDIIGSFYGEVHTQDLPALAEMIMDGKYIDLGKLISKKFRLEEINDVYEAMTKRQIVGRWVCAFE